MMSIKDIEILEFLMKEPKISRDNLAIAMGCSSEEIEQSLKKLIIEESIDEKIVLNTKVFNEMSIYKPQRAIILAAGFGVRMVPINTDIPKGLLKVKGELLIERLIRQLHEVSITDIYVVVGFMKERFTYLISEYGVKLVENAKFAEKNNLHSIKVVENQLGNAYIIPCDVWCARNPFRIHEMFSWYMVSNAGNVDGNGCGKRNGSRAIKIKDGGAMIGICYLSKEDAGIVARRINEFCQNQQYDNAFWEETLFEQDRMIISTRVVESKDVVEINTYEQLRKIDKDSNQLKTEAIDVISTVFRVKPEEITNITVLKKGMTNRSFLFTCKGRKHIMRIPGEGTDQLINRRQEAEVYQTIEGKELCDNIEYINPNNGYKISEFIEGTRVCDPLNLNDVNKCMKRLRAFHDLKLKVSHEFDIFKQIEFYEKLWNGKPSVYENYGETKTNILSLKSYIDAHSGEKVLTHIDAVPDNFLFIEKENTEEIRLIDWEYAGMQDPHVDVAMFSIYSQYNKQQVDALILSYFYDGCDDAIRIKIYCYIAACGLLWSNWCEFKRNLGVEFGEYAISQYHYAEEYYRIVHEELERHKGEG